MTSKWRVVVLCGALAALGAGGQGVELNNVMRAKLGHAQKMLAAVVTNNWFMLETQTRELEQLTKDPRWMILKYPEYARQSGAFVRALQDLHTAAAQRDLEKTPKAYVAVTLQCVECHRYLARERLAK